MLRAWLRALPRDAVAVAALDWHACAHPPPLRPNIRLCAGWLTHWGDNTIATRKAAEVSVNMGRMLDNGFSICLYIFR